MKQMNNHGSVLMECVLVLPLLLLLILGIAQFSHIWVAKLMTGYAAYSATRAAIVYNPADYRMPGADFFADKGPLHQAACIALAKLGYDSENVPAVDIPGWGPVGGSGNIYHQVRISGRDLAESADLADLPEDKQIQIPAIEVTVSFDFPLLVPYVGRIIGMFAAGGNELKWSLAGYVESEPGKYIADEHNTITLTQSCIMARPWSTNTFPLMAASDKKDWRLNP